MTEGVEKFQAGRNAAAGAAQSDARQSQRCSDGAPIDVERTGSEPVPHLTNRRVVEPREQRGRGRNTAWLWRAAASCHPRTL